jgi:energy-coupling factor transporter ATP-binding protein EcfA2
LDRPIPPKASKIHKVLSEALYDIPYIGANHFPNQAIAKINTQEGSWAAGSLYMEVAPTAKSILESLGLLDVKQRHLHSNNAITPIALDNITTSFYSDIVFAGIRSNQDTIDRFFAGLLSKRFAILTGLSGSGKTKLAHAIATWITPTATGVDPFAPGSKVVSDRITYYVKNSDKLSVEFWNNENPEEATIVTLPKAIIHEWANYVVQNLLNREVSARQLRESVSSTSKFSTQLHSFETHLKAAAFALIESQDKFNELSCYKIVPVGADWTSNENVLGFQDALQPNIYRKPASGALDLILLAERDPEHPYFLILDEMNLSHVERYFADILSTIETGQEIALHSSDKPLESFVGDPLPVPPKLRLPNNLFIIGTVNIDETTYMFSPKVLDRANVIEFRATADDIVAFLDTPGRIDMDALAGKGAGYGRAFVSAAQADVSLANFPPEIGDGVATVNDLKERLTALFAELAPIGAEFGYRTAFEVSRFFYHHAVLTGPGWNFKDALDAQVIQKLMPKLHGSDRKLRPTLEKLKTFCGAHDLKLSLAKTERMLERLTQDGFTSFAEA